MPKSRRGRPPASQATRKDEEARRAKLRWLRQVIQQSGRAPSAIANAAGLSASTLTRAVKPDYQGDLYDHTITKVAAVLRVQPPPELGVEELALKEPDVEPYEPNPDTDPDSNLEWWIVRGDGMTLAGYLPGDRIEVEPADKAEKGDVVLAQVYDNAGGAETVLRVFDAPFLTARCLSPPDPVLVDGHRAVIMRIVRRLHRDVKAA